MISKSWCYLPSRTLSRCNWATFIHNASGVRVRSFSSTSTQSHFLQPTIAQILHPLDQMGKRAIGERLDITVTGRIKSVRKLKNVAFAVLGDGSTTTPLQVVLSPNQASGLNTGTSVEITGDWKPSIQGIEQSMELVAKGVSILGVADPLTYPLQKKFHTAEYLRTMPHMRSRMNFNTLMLRLRSEAIGSFQQYFEESSFIQTHPPILTSSDCEGAGEVFRIAPVDGKSPFFGKETYLSVSSQLHLEALALSMGRVWTLSPTFRAEKSDTARHLSEFYMLEVELVVESLDAVMDITEEVMRSVASRLSKSDLSREILATRTDPSLLPAVELAERWEGLLREKWTRITYTHAIQHLQEAVDRGIIKFKYPITWGSALQSEHERFLATSCGGGGPIFITHYPTSTKPFYMLPTPEGGFVDDELSQKTVACFDLLVPQAGELAGGSMREHRLSELEDVMIERGMLENIQGQTSHLSWYLDLRRWGTMKHGGFGLGFDRFLAYLAGVENIREISTFPRWHGRCSC